MIMNKRQRETVATIWKARELDVLSTRNAFHFNSNIESFFKAFGKQYTSFLWESQEITSL